jgi:hypothetical protein
MEVAYAFLRHGLAAAAGAAWIVSIAWVIADARVRLARPRSVLLATAVVGLLPVAGLAVWLVVRPGETIAQRWAHDLRMLLFEHAAADASCLVCRTRLDPDFQVCPGCGIDLQRPCDGCGEPVHASATACASCGAPAAAQAPDAIRAAAR